MSGFPRNVAYQGHIALGVLNGINTKFYLKKTVKYWNSVFGNVGSYFWPNCWRTVCSNVLYLCTFTVAIPKP